MFRLSRFVVLAFACLAPSLAFAQASITGTVKDTSGAILPGVMVEAASDALIEKVRVAVTDATGQYRIVDLRPGSYALTFTLTGFNTVKREGIQLAGSFTATVNADLMVGTIEETVNVTGASPIVDVQSTQGERVMTKDVLDAIPAGRSHISIGVLIPGLSRASGQDVGGTNTLALSSMAIHGGRSTDQRVMIDGFTIRNIGSQGNLTNFIPDMGSSQEVAFDYASNSAEAVTSGVVINYIPKEGGNRFTGSFFGTAVNSDFQKSNYTPELAAQGLKAPNHMKFNEDINGSGGGPIAKDRLWFYSSVRWQNQQSYVAGLWNNLNAGDPTKWSYAPDLNNQAVFSLDQLSASVRTTMQASPRNKFNVYFEKQTRNYDNNSLSPAGSPESFSVW